MPKYRKKPIIILNEEVVWGDKGLMLKKKIGVQFISLDSDSEEGKRKEREFHEKPHKHFIVYKAGTTEEQKFEVRCDYFDE